MMVPGSNILNMALQAIAKTPFEYQAFVRRDLNTIGQDVPVYANPVMVYGSAQPPGNDLFERFGLDLQRNYMVFYVPKQMLDVDRNVSGDHIKFNGRTWQVESKTDWFAIDGWIQLISVEIPSPAC